MSRIDLERLMLRPFPESPLRPHPLLTPLGSVSAIAEDAEKMNIAFETLWIENVYEGVAYFFSWRGEPRATVLIVVNDDRVTHVECQGQGGRKIESNEFQPIGAVLQTLCRHAGLKLWERARTMEH